MSFFLVVVVFVFAFVPGILAPFTGGSQEETVAVDRIADQLSRGMLGSPTEPNVLDVTCTDAFFEAKQPDASGISCRYLDEDGDGDYPIEERIGVMDRTQVNVSIRGDVDGDGSSDRTTLCWDAGDRAFQELGTGDCTDADDTLLSGGELSPASSDVITARRRVSIGNHNATMYVHVS